MFERADLCIFIRKDVKDSTVSTFLSLDGVFFEGSGDRFFDFVSSTSVPFSSTVLTVNLNSTYLGESKSKKNLIKEAERK